MPAGQSGKLLTASQAAGRLGVTPATIRNWDGRGFLTAADRTPGGHRRWREADVSRALDNRQDWPGSSTRRRDARAGNIPRMRHAGAMPRTVSGRQLRRPGRGTATGYDSSHQAGLNGSAPAAGVRADDGAAAGAGPGRAAGGSPWLNWAESVMVGRNIRVLRMRKGWTLARFVAHTGWAVSGASRRETGAYRYRESDLQVLAELFGVSAGELVTGCVNCAGRPPAGFACPACGAAGAQEGTGDAPAVADALRELVQEAFPHWRELFPDWRSFCAALYAGER
jgi:transcriptional regulator with XRE-family HTH domain